MKRFSKFQKISSLVLAFIMTVSLALPYTGAVVSASEDSNAEQVYGLYQKKVMFCGDSICAASDGKGWAARIMEWNSMSGINMGESGASISTVRGSNTVIRQLELQAMTGNSYDYIILQGGVNDAWSEAPIGTMTDGTTSAFDQTTFAGGLEATIKYAKENFPNATLGYIANFNPLNATGDSYGDMSKLGDYFTVAEQICEKWGVVYLDLYSNDKLNNALVNDYATNMKDEVHPAAAGYDLIAPFINDWMKTSVVESTNDLTGWIKGTQGSVQGNKKDGWHLSLENQSITSLTSYSQIATGMDITQVRMILDLSTVEVDQSFWIFYTFESRGWSNWDKTRTFFNFKRSANDKLYFYAHTGDAELGKYTIDFDYSKPHTLEFLKDADDRWQLAIDGVPYKMENDTYSVDAFVSYLNKYLGPQTNISFVGTSSTACVLNNVKIGDKTLTVNESDTTGWIIGTDSTISGDSTDGWDLSVVGNVFTQGIGYSSCYKANIAVSNMKVSMDLSELAADSNLWLSFGNGRSVGWNDAGISFVLTKLNDNQLQVQGHTGSASIGEEVTLDVDFNERQVFELVKSGDVWKPSVNGRILETDCTSFVNNMLANYPEKTIVTFAPQGTTVRKVKTLKFEEKNLDGWNKGDFTIISGSADDGWKLLIAGKGYYDSTYGNFYTVEKKITDFQTALDLSTLTQGRNIWLSFGNDESSNTTGAWSTNNTKINFVLWKSGDSSLTIQAHNGGAAWGTAEITNFDFSQPHSFGFSKVAGQWQLTIDGSTYDMTYTGSATHTTVNAFVENMIATSSTKTVVGFASQSTYSPVIIENIKFVDVTETESDITGWTDGGTSTLTGTPTNGWNLSFAGQTLGTSSTHTKYATGMNASDVRVLMDLSTVKVGQDFWLAFTYNGNSWGNWNNTRVYFNLKRTSGNQLYFYAHVGNAEVCKNTIGFDYNKTHAFELLQDANGKWQFAIDGVPYSMEERDYTVDSFVQYMDGTLGPNTYVHLVNTSSTTCIIKNVKIGNKTLQNAENDTTNWTVGSNSGMTGNQADGWDLSFAGQTLGTDSTHTKYATGMNASDVRVLMDLSTVKVGQDFWLAFTYNGKRWGSWDNTRVYFNLKRTSGNQLYFYGHVGNAIVCENTISFDYNKTHAFELLQDASGKWQFAIDGVPYSMEERDYTVDSFVQYMNGTLGPHTYVHLINTSSKTCFINDIQIAPKMNALGATIATQFEENVPIKMGFDYSVIKKYLTNETLVNYGAVLVAKETSTDEMQDALIKALVSGNSFNGITYSADKKFMFTVGSGTTLPNNYYVTIKNSDDVQYMDRAISAIGYIVTQESDGTYNYYFTTNADASKNITNGTINKSVSDLLKSVSQEYLTIYDEVSEEEQQMFEDVITAFNEENESTYTIGSLRDIVTNGLAEAGTEEGNLQREFLKYVHLGLRDGVPTVLKVADYGAVGDGIADDTAAVARVLAVAQETQKKTLIVM